MGPKQQDVVEKFWELLKGIRKKNQQKAVLWEEYFEEGQTRGFRNPERLDIYRATCY
ncbi:hypothetical protein [Eudoraea algarum]|uniref:hypothetical protein n=1 Tax=Eudoraea algarum TaxID=3417568 RepID=UPI003F5D4DA1